MWTDPNPWGINYTKPAENEMFLANCYNQVPRRLKRVRKFDSFNPVGRLVRSIGCVKRMAAAFHYDRRAAAFCVWITRGSLAM